MVFFNSSVSQGDLTLFFFFFLGGVCRLPCFSHLHSICWFGGEVGSMFLLWDVGSLSSHRIPAPPMGCGIHVLGNGIPVPAMGYGDE